MFIRQKFYVVVSLVIFTFIFLQVPSALADTTTINANPSCTYRTANGSQCNGVGVGDYCNTSQSGYAGATWTLPSGTINSVTFHFTGQDVFGNSNSVKVYKSNISVSNPMTSFDVGDLLCTISVSGSATDRDWSCDITSGSFTSGQTFSLQYRSETGQNSMACSNVASNTYLYVDYTPGGGGGESTSTPNSITTSTLFTLVAASGSTSTSLNITTQGIQLLNNIVTQFNLAVLILILLLTTLISFKIFKH